VGSADEAGAHHGEVGGHAALSSISLAMRRRARR
jgi:hypothetical protein